MRSSQFRGSTVRAGSGPDPVPADRSRFARNGFRPSRRTTRAGLAGLLAVGALLLTGCTAPDPEVTFYADRVADRVGPAQYCDAQISHCAAHPEAAAVLRVPPGTSLQINVPSEIANTPWQVAFGYRDAAGQQLQGRTAVFTPAQHQLSYVLRLPDPGDQLETAEVQQFGAGLLAPETADQTGTGFEFVIRATWVLSVDDRPQP